MTVRRLLPALALVLAVGAHAQAPKIGYVDTDQVVIRMPEFASVQTQLRGQQQAVGERVRVVQDSLGAILRQRVEAYQTFDQSPLATDEARRERQGEILQLQAQAEQAEAQGYQYLSYTEARLLQPVLARVDEAIGAEARAQSVDLVLPTVANNAPVFVYASDRVVNLTEAVMRRLGIDPAAPAPSQGPRPPAGTQLPSGTTVPGGAGTPPSVPPGQ